MERPFVICHMVSSVDGKIDGTWFEAPEVGIPLKESGMIRNAYQCSTTLYGATTMAETYAEGFLKNLLHADITLSREDYIAHSEVDSYFVAIDPQGSIAYADKYIEKRGRSKVHVIEVLLESVSDDYLAYLRSLDISYIFAGTDSLDAALCMEKLHRLFGINKLMICGGGIVDYTFLQAGLIDELSLVIVPLTDGATDVATVFDRSPFVPITQAISFKLLEVKTLPGDGVWLRYQPKNTI